MEWIDPLALFIGRSVLIAGALGLSASVLFCAYGIVYLLFQYWSRKVFRGVVNFRAVRQWNANGRPEWKQKNGLFVQVPTTGPYEDPFPKTPRSFMGDDE